MCVLTHIIISTVTLLNPLGESSNEDWSWDIQSKITAQGLLTSLTNFTVLIAFVCVRYVLDTIKPLTLKLQQRDVDISKARKMLDHHVEKISEIRREADIEFETCFSDATQIANDLDIEIKVPRTCFKQQHRANFKTTEPKEYFKSTLAIPFLDYLLQELRSRFKTKDTSAAFTTAKHLLRDRQRPRQPGNLQQLTNAIIQEWRNIHINYVRRLIASMRRCLALMNAAGGHTRY